MYPSATEHYTLETPLGLLTLTQANDAIVGLAWAVAATRRSTGRPDARGGREMGSPVLDRAAEQLAEYFSGRRRAFDLPLNPAGTAFQRRVWAEMTRIPCGRTLSYGALARRLGSAARAVGQACGANPIPIIIPCHRVLGTRGRLGGYSGGAGPATKRALLELERALPGTPGE